MILFWKVDHFWASYDLQGKYGSSFANLIFKGKTSAALQLLSQSGTGGVLHANDVINVNDTSSPSELEVLKSEQTQAQPASFEATQVKSSEVPQVHPVVCDKIDARCICSAALNTKGAAGPYGIDSHNWRSLCTLFKSASHDLCHLQALLTRRPLSLQKASLP